MSRPILELPAFRRLLTFLPYALAVLVYAPSFANGFLWDDHALVANNSFVHDLSRVWELVTHDFWHVADATAVDAGFAGRYYRPVVTVGFAIQGWLFAMHPAGFHLVSLLLHLACCWLVHRALTLRLDGEVPKRVLAASLGTLLFAIHPTRPEVVGWISGATDLWMTFWSLVAVNVWTSHRHRLGGILAVIVASVLAMLSKETAIVLPFALAVDAWLLAKPSADRRDLWRSIAITLPVLATIGIRSWLMPIPASGMLNEGLGGLVRRVVASVGEYVLAILWHVPGTMQMAVFRYDSNGPIYSTTSLVVGGATISAILILTILAVRKESLRPWLADVAWFTAFLAPVANIVPLGMKALVAARFLYAPLFGAIALFSRAIERLAVANRRAMFATAAGATIAISAFFGFSSIRQLESFASDDALWEYEYTVDPRNDYAVGQLLRIHGEYRDAEGVMRLLREYQQLSTESQWLPMQYVDYFRQAIRALANVSTSKDSARLDTLARAYDDLVEKGVVKFTIDDFTMAFQIPAGMGAAMVERLPAMRIEHAVAHERAGNVDRAAELLREAIDAIPYDGRAWFTLARVEALRGNWREAQTALGRAASVGIPADKIEPLRLQMDEARGHAEKPGDEVLQRALAYRAMGSAKLVRPVLEEAVRARPGDPQLISMLVELELSDRRPEAAAAWIQAARGSAPQEEAAWKALDEQVASARARVAALR